MNIQKSLIEIFFFRYKSNTHKKKSSNYANIIEKNPIAANQIKQKPDLSSENEQPIRANRLSNREVMLSAAVLQNINMPSTSAAVSGGYKRTNRRLSSSVSSEATTYDKSEQSSNQTSSAAAVTTSSSASAAAAVANCVSSPSKSNADESDTNDELSLSQYELDIVNKYLNELCDSDESNDQNEIVKEKLDEQLAIVSSICIDSGEDDGATSIAKQTDRMINIDNDQCNGIHIESDTSTQSQSQIHSLDASTSSTGMQQHSFSHPCIIANANANDEMQCTQTSRQSGFDQPNQSYAMINQTMQRNTIETAHSPSHHHTHNDVNNNNISLSSNIGSHSDRSIDHRRYNNNNANNQNNNNHHQTSDSRRHCDNNSNMRSRTNPNATNDSNRISANLPIIVGIASCVWGLFFYAAKSFYSDLT